MSEIIEFFNQTVSNDEAISWVQKMKLHFGPTDTARVLGISPNRLLPILENKSPNNRMKSIIILWNACVALKSTCENLMRVNNHNEILIDRYKAKFGKIDDE